MFTLQTRYPHNTGLYMAVRFLKKKEMPCQVRSAVVVLQIFFKKTKKKRNGEKN
jgi:hypothetical protein